MKALVLLFALLFVPLSVSGGLNTSDPFPDFRLLEGLEQADYAYLGLKKGFFGFGARTDLKDIRAELLVLEFMNRYCITCQKEASELVRFYEALEKNPLLRKNVRLLGVAIGNDTSEIADFKREFSIPFPIVSDRETTVYRSIGSPGGSPLYFILKKTRGTWTIVDGFKGEQSWRDLLIRVQAALNQDASGMVRKPLWVERSLKKLNLSESLAALRQRLPSVRITKTIPFDNGDLYVLETAKEVLFAKAESRHLLCAVCHDIVFIYVFDRKGLVRDFIPIELAKHMNEPLSHTDIDRIRSSVVGKSMLAPFRFDGKTDAVTSATITSFAVHDAILNGKEIFETIRKDGL